MPKFRKKPVEVEAIQWTGGNNGNVMEWVGEHRDSIGTRLLTFVPLAYPKPRLWVAANNSWVEVEPGEWFIRDARGVYPCKPDIFEATYEPAEQPDPAQELRDAVRELLEAGGSEGIDWKYMYLPQDGPAQRLRAAHNNVRRLVGMEDS